MKARLLEPRDEKAAMKVCSLWPELGRATLPEPHGTPGGGVWRHFWPEVRDRASIEAGHEGGGLRCTSIPS